MFAKYSFHCVDIEIVKISRKFPNLILYNDENNAVKKVSFEWSHHRISSPQTQTSKPTSQDSIIHARSEGPE